MAEKNILSVLAMEKLLKRAGAERVAEDAKLKMIEVLEAYAHNVGEKATRMAKHAGRKTVVAKDIEEALR